VEEEVLTRSIIGGLSGGDQVVAFLNGGTSSRTITATLVTIFGSIRNSEQSMQSYELYDVWGNETVMPNEVAAGILNGTTDIMSAESGNMTVQGYYNATQTSFASGLMANDTRLWGTRVGTVSAGGSISTEVPSHGIAMWRLRSTGGGSMKRDEL
jgi:alpha-galactosidase